MKTKVMVVFGTRPEAIKMSPILRSLRENKDSFKTILCITSQHKEMLNQVLKTFKLKPDINLNIMKKNQDLFDITSNGLIKIKKCLIDEKPDFVMVHGDTTTAFVVSIACFYLNIPVSHIEAGLRTNNIKSPFPEEFNRQVITKISNLHFTPTKMSMKNLIKESIPNKQIFVTGNTVIDALFFILNKIEKNKKLKKIIIDNLNKKLKFNFLFEKFILITGHRRENFGDGFLNICKALKVLSLRFPDINFVYPVHLNPNVLKPVNSILKSTKNIQLLKPLAYEEFSFLLSKCYFVLTDSGGIQEEAPSLGKPVILMREKTERPEAVKSGTVILSGAKKNKIISLTTKLITNKKFYNKMSIANNPYGDGNSAKKIIKILINRYEK